MAALGENKQIVDCGVPFDFPARGGDMAMATAVILISLQVPRLPRMKGSSVAGRGNVNFKVVSADC